jgi:hypothetical protein
MQFSGEAFPFLVLCFQESAIQSPQIIFRLREFGSTCSDSLLQLSSRQNLLGNVDTLKQDAFHLPIQISQRVAGEVYVEGFCSPSVLIDSYKAFRGDQGLASSKHSVYEFKIALVMKLWEDLSSASPNDLISGSTRHLEICRINKRKAMIGTGKQGHRRGRLSK